MIDKKMLNTKHVIQAILILFLLVAAIETNGTKVYASETKLISKSGTIEVDDTKSFAFSIDHASKINIDFTDTYGSFTILIYDENNNLVFDKSKEDLIYDDINLETNLSIGNYKLYLINDDNWDDFEYSFTVTSTRIASTSDPIYKLNKTSTTLYVGETTNLSVSVKPNTVDLSSLSWESNDKSVATVNKDGAVRAVNKGNATITASIGEVTLDCKISVKEIKRTSSLIPFYVYLDNGSIKNEGKKHLSITNGIANQDEDWYTITLEKKTKIAINLESIADIMTPGYIDLSIMEESDEIGFYKSYDIFFPNKTKTIKYMTLPKGTYYIILSNDLIIGEVKNSYKYNLKIYNTTSEMDHVKLQTTKRNVYIGSDFQLLLLDKFNIAVFNTNIKWASSNENIATVSKTGNISAKNPGKCTITALLPNGKKMKCAITVPKPSLERQLYSKQAYAFVSDVSNKSIYNDCCIYIFNKSAKDMVYIEYEIIQYNSRGQYIKSPYATYYDDDTLKAGEEDSYVFWVNNDARKARVCIKNITYKDGSKWNNPLYKTWHNKYYGKKY